MKGFQLEKITKECPMALCFDIIVNENHFININRNAHCFQDPYISDFNISKSSFSLMLSLFLSKQGEHYEVV